MVLVYVFLVSSKVDSVHSCCWKLQFSCSINVANYQHGLEKNSVTTQFIMSCSLIRFNLTA